MTVLLLLGSGPAKYRSLNYTVNLFCAFCGNKKLGDDKIDETVACSTIELWLLFIGSHRDSNPDPVI